MPGLSSPVECIQDHFSIVVIGSDYGGAIAAFGMARGGQGLCIA